jgi:hypothetical protein
MARRQRRQLFASGVEERNADDGEDANARCWMAPKAA